VGFRGYDTSIKAHEGVMRKKHTVEGVKVPKVWDSFWAVKKRGERGDDGDQQVIWCQEKPKRQF